MIPPPPRHAPTTLKQAKKAYRKASAIPRLSEAELARIQRLEEREEKHERMRERERKRLLNKKKRDEKIAKEKELRKKMGLPEPGAPCVGPSQARISQFVNGAKMVRFDEAGKQEKVENRQEEREEKEEEEEEEEDDEEMPLPELDEEVLACLASPESEKTKPPRPPLQHLDGNRASQGAKGRASSPSATVAGDDDWASMFASNTQIQRELSIDDDDDDNDDEEKDANEKVIEPAQQPPDLPHRPRAKAADDTAYLLALISTQDLEDAEDGDQSVLPASTPYPEFTEEELRELGMMEPPVSASPQYPDFTEEELRDLEMSESSASASLVHAGPKPAAAAKTTVLPADGTTRGSNIPDTGTTSFEFDDFELSTQDLRELGA